MSRFNVTSIVVLAGALGLAGCGDKSEPQAKIEVVSAATATAPTDATGPRYEATLAEGIDFKKPGYPNFIAEVSGMSGYETWGRWTDAASDPVAKFRFKQALPKKFTLEITANALGPNSVEPTIVWVGSVKKSVVIGKKDAATYKLVFETDGAADTLVIAPPKPISPTELDPKSTDRRKLGIGFFSLKIKD